MNKFKELLAKQFNQLKAGEKQPLQSGKVNNICTLGY